VISTRPTWRCETTSSTAAAVSRRHGFVEYDGPIFEHLELYRVKSGDEIVSELFHLRIAAGAKWHPARNDPDAGPHGGGAGQCSAAA